MAASELSAEDLSRAQPSRAAELGAIGPHTLLPISQKPADIGIIVAGGSGAHSVYVPCFGNTRSVTIEVPVDDG